ncbi:MAG: hypothetical protein H0U60_06690 [Blastocatellia bacterium]|nr:hypothetical protein [Blastocatellia bacterium]
MPYLKYRRVISNDGRAGLKPIESALSAGGRQKVEVYRVRAQEQEAMALCQEVAARASALLEDQGDRLVELVVIQVRLRVAEDQYLDYDAFLSSSIPILVRTH